MQHTLFRPATPHGKKFNYALSLKHRFYSNKQLKIVISAKVQLKADLHTSVKHSDETL